MVSTASLSRYWAATLILLCVLYWSFRAAKTNIWSTIPKVSTSDDNMENSRPRPEVMEVDQEQHLAQAMESTFLPGQEYPSRFPRFVWQTASKSGRARYADKAKTWQKVQGFDYHFLSGEFEHV